MLGNKDIVDCFIKHKVDVNFKGEYDISPLTVACYFNNEDVISQLIEAGAEINVKDKNGILPLHIVKFFKNKNKNIISKLKKEKGEDNNSNESNNKDNDGNSTKYDGENKKSDNSQKGSVIMQNYTYDINHPNKILKPIIKFEELIEIANRSVCIIKIGNSSFGTGFFIEFQTEYGTLRGLMTNNHVLNSSRFKLKKRKNEIFKIYIKGKKDFCSISLNDMSFIFTEEVIDVTFIQLKDNKINKINPYFLKIDDSECYEKEEIMIIQYPVDDELAEKKKNYFKKFEKYNIQNLSITYGSIKSISGFNIIHDCSTYQASSGSPLINGSLKVVGIHKFNDPTENENYSTKLTVAKYAICTAYKRKYTNEIKDTINVVEELTQDKIDILKKYSLNQYKNNKNLFIYKRNKQKIPPLMLYRTNHAWYWTDEVIEGIDKIKLYEINIKWTIIIPHDEFKNFEENETFLIRKHKILIMWLRLSEFMFL